MSLPYFTWRKSGFLYLLTLYLMELLTFSRLWVPTTTVRFLSDHRGILTGVAKKKEEMNERKFTHLQSQCAAVRTKSSLMRNPPQMCFSNLFCSETMYSIKSSGTFLPFMISLPSAAKQREGVTIIHDSSCFTPETAIPNLPLGPWLRRRWKISNLNRVCILPLKMECLELSPKRIYIPGYVRISTSVVFFLNVMHFSCILWGSAQLPWHIWMSQHQPCSFSILEVNTI